MEAQMGMAPTQFAPPTQTGFQGSENGVFPIFFKQAKYMPAKSQETGVPTSEPIDMVKIIQAGEKDTVILAVDETHKRRWPQQWAAYQAGQEQMQSGTPLIVLFPANPEIVEECKRINVHTVQALIGVPDSAGAVMPFLTTWKQKAQQFIAGTEKGKGFHELERQLSAAQAENKELADRLAALEARLSKKEPA